MNLRKTIYFLKDKILDNSIIIQHLNDIKSHYNHPDIEANILDRKKRLESLLSYTTQYVPFYKEKNYRFFDDFPVVDKNTIREDYSKFISDQYRMEKLTFVTTSGSTGTPFKSYRDETKILRHKADNIFLNSLAGGDIGQRLYYFRVWNHINRKSTLQKFVQNIEELDASDFSQSYVEGLLEKIQKDKSKKYFLSYASSYEALANAIQKLDVAPVQAKVSCIISMSETLPEVTRNYLEYFFNCPVLSRYSNMENGFIAQQSLENKTAYYLNSGSFLVEILELNSNNPVKDGELGRIVVTDYFNYGMPIIRYDTGDLGVMSKEQGRQILSNIEGRRTDFIISTTGQLLSPHMITNTMWKFPNIRQFQFIQKTDRHYLMKINCVDNVNENVIKNEFKNFLGDNALISFEYVQEIPILSSGKRKKIVNEYKVL